MLYLLILAFKPTKDLQPFVMHHIVNEALRLPKHETMLSYSSPPEIAALCMKYLDKELNELVKHPTPLKTRNLSFLFSAPSKCCLVTKPEMTELPPDVSQDLTCGLEDLPNRLYPTMQSVSWLSEMHKLIV